MRVSRFFKSSGLDENLDLGMSCVAACAVVCWDTVVRVKIWL